MASTNLAASASASTSSSSATQMQRGRALPHTNGNGNGSGSGSTSASSSTSFPRLITKRVAIIGGGSAGVVQAQQLYEVSEQQRRRLQDGTAGEEELIVFETTIYERRPKLGAGLWMCDEDPGECVVRFNEDGRGWPTSDSSGSGKSAAGGMRRWPPGAMYDGLRTNIPCDLMSYRDAPFPPHDVSEAFPSRKEVEDYLVNYATERASEGSLGNDVRLNTAVTRLSRSARDEGKGTSTWRIESLDLSTGEKRVDDYSHVVLANGRCNVPSIPPIPGLWNFTASSPHRKLLHSAWYRTPWSFSTSRRVVVVGNASSGMDVARELRGYIVRNSDEILGGGKESWIARVERGEGPEVINSVMDVEKPPPMDYDPRDEGSPAWSRAIKVVPRIERVERDGTLLLADGSRLRDVDAVVFATGFHVQWEMVDFEVEPFRSYPLVRRVPTRRLVEEGDEKEDGAALRAAQMQAGTPKDGKDAYSHPSTSSSPQPWSSPAAPGPSNLDDWLLLYAADDSLGILGLPTGVVPFVFTHVQARYIAAYWAGQARALPALDRELGMADGARWTSRAKDGGEGERDENGVRGNDGPMPLVFGTPSDFDYVDALLGHIDGAGEEPPSTHEDRDGEGKEVVDLSSIKGREEARRYWLESTMRNIDEGREEMYRVRDWRRSRRKEGKVLRKLLLGY